MKQPMSDPLVSIVISSFNCEKYLTASIESALSQTYRHIEVIVVVKESADSAQTIIKRFGSGIHAVFRPDEGPIAACNTGFGASSGSIVLFLDADDVLFPAAVRQITEAWEDGAAKVQYLLELINDEGKSKGTAFPRYPKNYTPQALHRDFLARGNYPWPAKSGNAFDRGFLAKILPLSAEAFPFAPEGVMSALAPLFGNIISLPRPLAFYRFPGSNRGALSSAIPARFFNHIRQKEWEAAYLRRYAQASGVVLPHGNLLDGWQSYVESRLCASKLGFAHPAGEPRYDLHRLCYLVLRNLAISREAFMWRISSLLFCVLLVCSTGKLASRLIALRFDPASRPKFPGVPLKSLRLNKRRFLA